jgi:hypothetical protein
MPKARWRIIIHPWPLLSLPRPHRARTCILSDTAWSRARIVRNRSAQRLVRTRSAAWICATRVCPARAAFFTSAITLVSCVRSARTSRSSSRMDRFSVRWFSLSISGEIIYIYILCSIENGQLGCFSRPVMDGTKFSKGWKKKKKKKKKSLKNTYRRPPKKKKKKTENPKSKYIYATATSRKLCG